MVNFTLLNSISVPLRELPSQKFGSNIRDGYVILKSGNIVKIIDIDYPNEQIRIQKFTVKEPYFLYPLDSTKIHVYLVRRLKNVSENVHMKSILRKCVVLPSNHDNDLVCFLHTV